MSRMHRLRRRHASASAAAPRACPRAGRRAARQPARPSRCDAGSTSISPAAGRAASVAAAYEADRLALRGAARPAARAAARPVGADRGRARARSGDAAAGGPRPSGRALALRSGARGRCRGSPSSPSSSARAPCPVASTAARRSPTSPARARRPSPSRPPPLPGPTPIAVGAGSVGWVGTSPDGELAYNVTAVSQVCPADRQPDCAPVADGDSQSVDSTIRPKSISQSPVRNQAVVVGTDAQGDDSVVVIALPTAEPSRDAGPDRRAVGAPTATAGDSRATGELRAAAVGEHRRPSRRRRASAEPTPADDPDGRPPTPTSRPSRRSPRTWPSCRASRSSASRPPISPDGAWFAFTARPSDDSAGPGHLRLACRRRAGPAAHDDHAASSPRGSATGSSAAGRSRHLPTRMARPRSRRDRSSSIRRRGQETALAAPVWRPIVDPAGDRAVTWDGTVKLGSDRLTSVPATGSLVLRGFSTDVGPDAGRRSGRGRGRWPALRLRRPLGRDRHWLAVWVADATDPTIGRLSLFHLDPVTGALDRPDGAPQDVTALPGFSIADKPSRVGDPARPGRRGQPRPDRRLDRRRGRRGRERPDTRASSSSTRRSRRRGASRRRSASRDADRASWRPAAPAKARPSTGASAPPRCVSEERRAQRIARAVPAPRHSRRAAPADPAYGLGLVRPNQVGRRVGAHRGPRPGRAAGSCRFTGPQPDRTGPGRRVPATHDPRGRSAIDGLDRAA